MKENPQRTWSVRHYQKLLPNLEHLPEELRRRWTYVTLFPNISFDVYADKMDFFQLVPLAPGECLLRGRTYALPDERRETRAARYLGSRINRRVQDEDNALTLSVQGGLGVKGFQDWIRTQLPVGKLYRPPPAGTIARRNRDLAQDGPN
jgi:phenylpropionate dioxygenase-like ring-hydroxylating dioxygenase large terminal subunit